MDDSNKARFMEIMTGIAENFSNKLSVNGIKMMFDALKMYDIEQIEKAAIEIMRTNIYPKMPTVGLWVETIEGRDTDMADYQARLVLKAINRSGINGKLSFKDPTTQSLVFDVYGWSKLCKMKENELRYFVEDFKKAYMSEKKVKSVRKIGRIENERMKDIASNITKRIE